MIYVVQKRGGVWTVATDQVLLSFENYAAAVEAAQGAADVIRRSGRHLDRHSQVGGLHAIQSAGDYATVVAAR